ncbi:MAG: protelomerase family protein, partial [Xenococcaceae cyanobacterium]
QQFTESIRERWANEHDKPKLTQQQRLMDMTRRAIKDALGSDHWSLEYVKLSKFEYTQINDLKQGRVADRNEQVQFLDCPDEIVSGAVELLNCPDWAEVAAGLAVLTGRRCAELLSTASFEIKSKYSVTFTGAVKRRGEKGLTFEIPTLTTAERVIDAISKLRRELPEAISISARDVNAKYGQSVAKACDRHFINLVPTRPGQESLYTHLFRSVYACIATFWYCPTNVNETEFKAAIQGHFQIQYEDNPQLKRSLAASRHYSDYEIADSVIAKYQGKRKGIKLEDKNVLPLEMFARLAMPVRGAQSLELEKQTKESRTLRRKVGQIRIFQDTRDRWHQILEQIAASGNQQEKSERLLEWIEEKLAQTENLQPEETNSTNTSDSLSFSIAPTLDVLEEPRKIDEYIEKTKPPVTEPVTVVTTIEDPLRQDIQQLVSAIANLVSLQQAALTASNVRPKGKTAISSLPTPRSKADSKDGTEQINSNGRVKASMQDSQRLIDSWIEAIMNYNDAPDRRHDEKWAITISLLKSVGGSQPRIVKTLSKRPDIIEHHHHHQLDPDKHNLKHRGKHKITDLIEISAIDS